MSVGPRVPAAWLPMAGAIGAAIAVAAVLVWRINGQQLDAQIAAKRAALKKLVLSGSIPPNQAVMEYFSARHAALVDRYHQWLGRVTAPPMTDAAKADPQLYFQEQFHRVQGLLERLAAARGVAAPEPLGFPKELPPSDTVPRLLVQLALLEEATTLAFQHGAAAVASVKVEDPQPVSSEDPGEGPLLTRLPVRMRLSSSLPHLAQLLAALHNIQPLVDVRLLRLQARPPSDLLEAELVLARYLAMPGTLGPAPAAPTSRPPRRGRPR